MIPFFPSDLPPEDHFRPSGQPRTGLPVPADEELALRVADRLRAILAGPVHRIMVEVQNRVVILEGVVATREIRSEVHRLVERTPGVADISNRLTTWNDDRPGPFAQ